MSQGIFASEAPKYWERGMSAIPLHAQQKFPVPKGWSRWSDTEIPEEARQEWLNSCSNGNVGLALGPQSGCVMIDIDTPDEDLVNTIVGLLPDSPWCRIGKKGMVLAYRYKGLGTFRIKDVTGAPIVEHLSKGSQVVLPPSIHPDTKKPYTANCDLYDVVDQLPELPDDIEEILREGLAHYGVDLSKDGWTKMTDWVAAGARDVTMTSMAGYYAFLIRKGECSLKEGVNHLQAWADSTVEKVAGDELDIDKGVRQIVSFLARDVVRKNEVLPTGWDDDLSDEEKEEMGLEFDENSVEWTYDEIRTYLKEEFEKYPSNQAEGRMSAVNTALIRIANAQNLDHLSVERLFTYITQASGCGLSLTALRRQLRELRSGDLEGQNQTEIAQAVIDDLQEVTEHCYTGGEFRRWNGSHWEVVKRSLIMKKIAEEYGGLPAARKAGDHLGIVKIMESLIDRDFSEEGEVVNGVNFANGFLTEKGQLVEHNPRFGMTYTLPFRYLPDEAPRCEKWLEFLRSSFEGDEDAEEKIAAIQEMICATLFGKASEYHRAYLLYGVPFTGKSVTLGVMSELMPREAQCSVSPEGWNDKYLPAEMYGKRLNICGELSDERKIDGTKFKEITTGEMITGQKKHQQPFDFRPKCAHWFASNHLPTTGDTSEGFNRRWLIITFNHPVAKQKRELNLHLKLVSEEREAIVAWAVEAMDRLKEQKDFTLPESHKEMIREMAQNNNSVRFFIEGSDQVLIAEADSLDSTNGKNGLTFTCSQQELYEAYQFFCARDNVRPVKLGKFRAKIRELSSTKGFRKEMVIGKHGQKEDMYVGITLAAKKGG